MNNQTIISISYKYKDQDQDKDIILEEISSLEMQDKRVILVRMKNGHSFPVPAKIGLQVSKVWLKQAKENIKITEDTITVVSDSSRTIAE